ncbi:MAG TPA: vWA domain-containing protein [Kofleriaceae bacterium]|nr:vWA domain-containing protein [Kofleriaceae bacterium]
MRWLAVLVLLAAWPSLARAFDEDPPPSRVTARLSGTTIELTARYDLVADASIWSGVPISTPDDSIVTRAVATVEGTRHVLALVDTQTAQKELDGVWSENLPKGNHRWFVHVSGTLGFVTLDVLSPKATTSITLELTVEVPGCFFRDRRYARVPETWLEKLAGAPAIDDEQALRDVCAPDAVPNERKWISFASPTLARRPVGETRIGAFAGRLPLGHDDLARVEIDLASELSRVPPDLHTAIVIDHSRSLSGDEVETERAVVASYLQHVPAQSRVQVIAYAREAKPLLAAWMPAATARASVDREIRSLAPRNGSNVDVAIAEAGRWLARANGTRRLIIISDDRFASAIEAKTGDDIKALLPEHTLVHVVVVSAGTLGMQMTDRTQLGGIAELTEGIAVAAGVDEKEPLDATMLVRPLSIDKLTIKGRGWEDLGIGTCRDTVSEGQSCTWWGQGTTIAGALTVEAWLWGHKLTKTLVPDATSARHLARELSVSSHFLDDDLRAKIDHAAFAVNEAWSLFGQWGGPLGQSEGGFGFGRSGFGPGGCCSTSDFATGITGVLHPTVDVKAQVAPIVERCGAKTPLVIRLQTTREEIIYVDVNAQNESATVRSCIEEGIWDLALSIPNAPWRASATLKLN